MSNLTAQSSVQNQASMIEDLGILAIPLRQLRDFRFALRRRNCRAHWYDDSGARGQPPARCATNLPAWSWQAAAFASA